MTLNKWGLRDLILPGMFSLGATVSQHTDNCNKKFLDDEIAKFPDDIIFSKEEYTKEANRILNIMEDKSLNGTYLGCFIKEKK
jgi:hypothetical protein